MEKNNKVGVITGDIINSSVLSKNQKNKLKNDLTDYFDNNPDVLLPLQFYRGDSFQLMVKKEKAAMSALIIEAILLKTSGTLARISIGIGAVSKIAPGNVLQSEGEAFQLSGHQLDKMKAEDRLMKLAINSVKFQPILSATFYLVESIVWGWKPGQASVIAQIPVCKTQKEIAERLNITGAAVSKAIKASNWPAIEEFLKGYEETIKNDI
ncbi:MAG: hypothetical protein JW798_04860 [Prolixibacteraceae bacterium]|nr:hypothetical protein [Prolixibacteraceae bacterium]